MDAYKGFEVRGVIRQDDNCVSYVTESDWEAEQKALDEKGQPYESFHTLYGIYPNGVHTALADFISAKEARHVLELLTSGKTFTRNESLAGLCVWEAFLEAGDTSPMGIYRAQHGAVASREYALELGLFCDSVYASKDSDAWDEWSFDWEIVPEILDYLATPIARQESDFGDPESVANVIIARLSSRT